MHDLLTPIPSLTNYRDMTPFVLAADRRCWCCPATRSIALSREEA